ncbi:4-fold beta flower protein [Ketobacter sp.]|uniref:4-fold beta flower protein n=1 Tax=Ketobacter sp. TaxID=2083498 RepID=UPI0025B9A77B|nr:hypothetical protein [Ketobacter sp.]
MKTVKCRTDSSKCLTAASVSCGDGGYQVYSSESHAGGMLADIIPGPVTWYSMSYVCGPTDGTIPEFRWTGPTFPQSNPSPMVGSNSPAQSDNELSLFDRDGKAAAYVALDDELTIYLWGGEPVAYLDVDNAGGYHVYGFNGKHLGWFVNGVVWAHDGNASCATSSVLRTTQVESFKAFKQFKPFKSFKEFAPFRPFLTSSFGDTQCMLLLSEGRD